MFLLTGEYSILDIPSHLVFHEQKRKEKERHFICFAKKKGHAGRENFHPVAVVGALLGFEFELDGFAAGATAGCPFAEF